MTADRAALVERVRDIIAGSGNCDRWCEGSVNPHCGCRDDANEATKIIRAEVLEEAARVADEQSKALLDEAHDQKVWGNGAMSKRALSIADFFSQHAAALRALKEK